MDPDYNQMLSEFEKRRKRHDNRKCGPNLSSCPDKTEHYAVFGIHTLPPTPAVSTPQQYLARIIKGASAEVDRCIQYVEENLGRGHSIEVSIVTKDFSEATLIAVEKRYRAAGWVTSLGYLDSGGVRLALKVP